MFLSKSFIVGEPKAAFVERRDKLYYLTIPAACLKVLTNYTCSVSYLNLEHLCQQSTTNQKNSCLSSQSNMAGHRERDQDLILWPDCVGVKEPSRSDTEPCHRPQEAQNSLPDWFRAYLACVLRPRSKSPYINDPVLYHEA